jgi:hypothetical protein
MDNTLLTKFSNQLDTFEQKVLVDLLKSHSISPAQFKQVVLTEVRRNEEMPGGGRL